MKDLRDWLQEVENRGELVRISEEVDWDEEMGAIVYMGSQKTGAPAFLFDKVKDSPEGYRALFNVFGSLDKLALALRLPTEKSHLEIIQLFRDKLGIRIEPKIVDAKSAPVNENIDFGDDVDLYKFPSPKMWPLDGGRYIGTADAVITRDPDTGTLNLGTYRQMIQSKNEVGFWVSPGKDGLLHREAWWKRGEPCEVAVAYGMDPLLFAVSSLHYPKHLSEYEFAGGIQGEPIEVVKGEVTDLLIPARAEIVIEGVAYPGKVQEEGPFGEFNGYYGRPAAPTPVIDVKCVHYRDKPILTNSLVANYPCEPGLFHAVAKSASVWENFMTLGIPGIKGVYMPPGAASGMAMLVVSLEQMYAGHSAQVAAVAAQCTASAYFTKWIVVVDDDVDPTDINQVLWAMSTRCSPTDDIDILRNTWSTYLDPTKNPPDERPYGSKAIINACKEHKYLNTFARKTNITRDTYDLVKGKWAKLGLKGVPPELRVFEDQRS
ncbi:UbiD family decarboxylase [Chloroflexota bacterium]